MPRPRKYDYKKDLPDTLFIKIPIELKNKLEDKFTKTEINQIVTKYLEKFVENDK